MTKFRVNVIERNRKIEIAYDEWLKIKGSYRWYPNLFEKYNEFYDIYLDGERYTCASFRCHFELKFKDILNAKQLFLKQFKTKISQNR